MAESVKQHPTHPGRKFIDPSAGAGGEGAATGQSNSFSESLRQVGDFAGSSAELLSSGISTSLGSLTNLFQPTSRHLSRSTSDSQLPTEPAKDRVAADFRKTLGSFKFDKRSASFEQRTSSAPGPSSHPHSASWEKRRKDLNQ
eukprot:CAMPEP_0177730268 /NCGR_PEP_ID=MMETSP0484_2-20121128/21892_1 /TAXON_ID=354590 /ORGANISM="Rhodomonas lens, Strain RHODO" /LENGTH=142 /DNA_ID=CAMNT_0019243233 /DNA_START=38 /DNA_END=463 /DNA_ORIENTATION=+